MNDIETLKDYIIVDEINRLHSLTSEEVFAELLSINTKIIEKETLEELLKRRNATHE